MKENINGQIEELRKLYKLSEEEYKSYLESTYFMLTAVKQKSKDRKVIIVGGQSGAGKSKLIPVSSRELDYNAVIVDFDELRQLNPYFKQVTEEYPEITHRILHGDTERVKNDIINELIKNNYNVIYEGALRNTEGFKELAEKFRNGDYKIEMDIMAVSKLESFGSTYMRYAIDLADNNYPRWVEKSAHDGSYDGVPRTMQALIENKLCDEIRIYTRGEDEPHKFYTMSKGEFESPIRALQIGRERGRREAIKKFDEKYNIVKTIFLSMKPEFVPKLEDWRNLYEEEKSYFVGLEGVGKND